MPDHRGYAKALRLLQEKYGNELKVATALIEKASKWPQIKSEDAKALNAFSVFLVSCRNVMEDIDYMEEMDNPTNMRAIIAKLPFRTRERWRVHAFDIQEKRSRRARFAELVNFVERQAKIISDPLFGDLDLSVNENKTTKKSQQGRQYRKEGKQGSSFATKVEQVEDSDDQGESSKSKTDVSFKCAFTKPCIFCERNHTLQECYCRG